MDDEHTLIRLLVTEHVPILTILGSFRHTAAMELFSWNKAYSIFLCYMSLTVRPIRFSV